MNQGLELLMKRLETHPEEFTESGKWWSLIEQYEEYMPEEEMCEFRTAHDKLFQEKFTEAIMKKLFEEEEPKVEASPFAQAATQRVGQIQGLTSQQAMQMQQAHLAAQQNAMNQAQGYWGSGALASGSSGSSLLSNLSNATSTISLRDRDSTLSNSIRLGDQTLTTKMLKKLKKLIK